MTNLKYPTPLRYVKIKFLEFFSKNYLVLLIICIAFTIFI